MYNFILFSSLNFFWQLLNLYVYIYIYSYIYIIYPNNSRDVYLYIYLVSAYMG